MPVESIMKALEDRLGETATELLIPPPVFETMQGAFVRFDPDAGELITRFPVLKRFLNPYGAMQGGMVAAAVDNTLGPLSMLVAPPNVTRRLEMKYSRPVTPELGHFSVEARLLDRQGQRLTFRADVRDPEGTLLARASATHWVLEGGQEG